MPCHLLNGQSPETCGPQAALASLSPAPGAELARMMRGIFGQALPDWSLPASPIVLWVSRLQARLPTPGSTMWRMTWKQRVTPAGRPIFRLSPSARHIGANDSGGSQHPRLSPWPTPQATQATSRSGPRRAELLLQGLLRRTNRPLVRGTDLKRSSAPMENTGFPNPEFAGWLMGYPTAWSACGPTTPTRRKKPAR